MWPPLKTKRSTPRPFPRASHMPERKHTVPLALLWTICKRRVKRPELERSEECVHTYGTGKPGLECGSLKPHCKSLLQKSAGCTVSRFKKQRKNVSCLVPYMNYTIYLSNVLHFTYRWFFKSYFYRKLITSSAKCDEQRSGDKIPSWFSVQRRKKQQTKTSSQGRNKSRNTTTDIHHECCCCKSDFWQTQRPSAHIPAGGWSKQQLL